MDKNLLQKIIRFQRNQDNFMEILSHFNLKIKYLSHMLKYPEAETDLIIYLYELLRSPKLKTFENDKELLAYISKCLKNKSIALFHKISKDRERINFTEETELLDVMNFKEKRDEYSDVMFRDLISSLKPRQKQITFYKFYLQLSDVEIAEIFKISRQAVNKAQRLALKNLKTRLSS